VSQKFEFSEKRGFLTVSSHFGKRFSQRYKNTPEAQSFNNAYRSWQQLTLYLSQIEEKFPWTKNMSLRNAIHSPSRRCSMSQSWENMCYVAAEKQSQKQPERTMAAWPVEIVQFWS
jgi:hypothetical protein